MRQVCRAVREDPDILVSVANYWRRNRLDTLINNTPEGFGYRVAEYVFLTPSTVLTMKELRIIGMNAAKQTNCLDMLYVGR
jgi:hypothetical protein